MAIRIELTWDKTTTVGEIEQFISQAKAAGADTGTVIEDITHDKDPDLTLGWQIEVEGGSSAAPASALTA